MPVKVVKRVDGNKIPTDGFDPDANYQMVPLGSTREMFVETGEFRAELSVVASTLVTAMSNFRVLLPGSNLPSSLPGPNLFVQKVIIPERTLVQFTLTGGNVGMTVIRGRDLPNARPPAAKPNFQLMVSVKKQEMRFFTVCYLFDRINRDKRVRLPIAQLLNEVNGVFEQQTNFSVRNIDGPAASTLRAKTLTINGSVGKRFNVYDKKLIGRVIDAFNLKFPNAFSTTHGVIFVLPVPITARDDKLKFVDNSIVAINLKARRTVDNRSFNIVFVGSVLNKDFTDLRHALAHEIGHSFGLDHNTQINLMFPSLEIKSKRLNMNQIEIMHLMGPQFRQVDY